MILKATNSHLSFLQRLQRYLFSQRDKNLQLLRPLSPQTAKWYLTLSNLFLEHSVETLTPLVWASYIIQCFVSLQSGKEKETIFLFKTVLNSSISFYVFFNLKNIYIKRNIYLQIFYPEIKCFNSFFLLGIYKKSLMIGYHLRLQSTFKF